MADVYKGLTIEFGADATGLSRELKKIRNEGKSAEKELKKVGKALKSDPGNADALDRQLEKAKQRAEAARKELETLNKVKEQYAGTGKMTDEQWDHLEGDIIAAKAKVEEYERAVREADAKVKASRTSVKQLGEKWQDVGGKVDKALSGVRKAGDQLTQKVTVPMVAASGAAVKAAVDLDTALTDVRKTVDGTEEDYQNLKKAAMEFSEVNAVSATDMLSIEALGAQLGYTLDLLSNGKSEIQEFGEVVSGLDIATNMSAEQAGTELAQFFNIMDEAKENTERFGSTIVGLGNNLATTESDISAMAMRIAGAGKSIGLSSADVLGLAGALTSLGINAEAGGTAISTVMSEIDKSVALNDENLATWAKTARMSSEEFAAAWKDNAVGALDAVLKGMAAGVEEGGNLAVMLDELGISSLRQTDMLKRLANNSDILTDSVSLANQTWEENTALSNEVANRNDSLAAKFEMLKNQITNIAAEVGEPLADALLDCLSAMQPLVDAIKESAEAFNEMDEGQQRMVIGAAAAVAALGPLLSVVGRVGGAITSVGNAMSTLGDISGRLQSSSSKLASSIGGVIGSGKAGLVALAVAAAAAVAAFAYSEWKKYREHIENVNKATNGLMDAQREAQASSSRFGTSVKMSFADVKKAVDEVTEAQAKLADEFKEQWTEQYTSEAQLEGYISTIEELRDKENLTSYEQERLKSAVEGYNEVTGQSVAITDAQNGKLSASSDELKKNADAWRNNAEAQIYAQQAKDAVENRIKAQDALNAVEREYNQVLEWRDQAKPGSDAYNAYTMELARLEGALEEARGDLDAMNGAEEDLIAKSAAVGDGMRDFIESISGVSDALDGTGLGVDDLAGSLARLGYSQDELSKLTPEQWGSITSAYDGSAESVSRAMAKMAGVTDADFDRMWKSCDGDVNKMKSKIAEWNKVRAENKYPTVNASGNVIDGTAISRINEYLTEAKKLNNSHFTSTIVTTMKTVIEEGGQAAGGLTSSALRAIPAHAAGGLTGIATQPVLTNYGWVGEDGAEALVRWAHGTAIVPLTNRQYVRPFAQAVASEMGVGGNVTNVYLNDVAVNSNPAIMAATEEYLGVLARYTAMGGK